jgi:hypothetical protein
LGENRIGYYWCGLEIDTTFSRKGYNPELSSAMGEGGSFSARNRRRR